MLRRVGPLRHGDGAVRRPQRRNIVHAVPGHGHRVSGLLQCLNDLFLLVRRHPAEDGVFSAGLQNLLLSGQLPGVHGVLPSFDARRPGGPGHGSRRVSADHLQRHALFPEVAYGVLRPGPHLVLQAAQGKHPRHLRQRLSFDRSLRFRQDQHPSALGGHRVHPAAKGLRIGAAHHKLRRAKDQRLSVAKAGGGFLSPGGEGLNRRRTLRPRGHRPPQRFQRGAGGVKGPKEPAQRFPGLFLSGIHGLDAVRLHPSAGQGPRLIQAKDIHPGQPFNPVQLLHQNLLLSQPDHAHGHSHAGQQHQPLRDHAQHRRHHARHGRLQGHMLQQHLLHQQQRSQRQQRVAVPPDQLFQFLHQAAFGLLFLPGGFGQPSGIALLPDVHRLADDFSFRHIGSGIDPVPLLLRHRVAFPGQQAFHGPAGSPDHHSVRHGLVSAPQHHQVALRNLFRGDLLLRAFPDHPGLRRVQQLQLPDGVPGFQLLNNGDPRVADHNQQKQHIPPGSHQGQAESQQQIQSVKKGQGIAQDDLQGAFPVVLGHRVSFPAGGFRLRESLRPRSPEILRQLQHLIHSAPRFVLL